MIFEILILIAGAFALLATIFGWHLVAVRICIALFFMLYGLTAFPYPKEDRHKKWLAIGCVCFVASGLLSITTNTWWPLPLGLVLGYGAGMLLDKGQAPLPAWVKAIPAHMRPSQHHIDQLESIRQQVDVGHDEFYQCIYTHSEMTRKVLRLGYRNMLMTNKAASRHDHFANILMTRVIEPTGMVAAGGIKPFGLDSSARYEDLAPAIRDIVSRFQDIDQLIDFINEDEKKHEIPSHESAQAAFAEISRILAIDTEEQTWKHGEAPSLSLG